MLISAIGRDKQHHNSRGGNYKYYSIKYPIIVGSLHLKTLTYIRRKGRVITSPDDQKATRFPIGKIGKLILSFAFLPFKSHFTQYRCYFVFYLIADKGCRIRSCPLFTKNSQFLFPYSLLHFTRV